MELLNDGLFIHLEIPIGVLAVKEITLVEKLVLACLMQNVDRELNVSTISIRGAAHFLSLTPKQVSDAMFELERKGFVERQIDGFVFFDHPSYHMTLKREREMAR